MDRMEAFKSRSFKPSRIRVRVSPKPGTAIGRSAWRVTALMVRATGFRLTQGNNSRS
jgi:hypothetical protein